MELNKDKTEAILFLTLSLPSDFLPSSVTVGTHQIEFSDKVRNLKFILDSNLTMKQHVIKVCQTAHYELKLISSIRSYLTEDATKKLVTSCVLSRLDYCNSLLMGTPNSVIQPMQISQECPLCQATNITKTNVDRDSSFCWFEGILPAKMYLRQSTSKNVSEGVYQLECV